MSAAKSCNSGKYEVVLFVLFYLGFFELARSKPLNDASTISNLAVSVFEDTTYRDSNEGHGPLKLNITWNVLVNKRKPSSYSILITSLNKHDDDASVKLCPEETLFHTTSDGDRCHAVLPENQFFSEAPELSIRPTCTYGIQVFANPRSNPKVKVPEVILNVPKCVGGWCSCEEASEYLPVPKIDIISQTSKDIEVKWTVGSSDLRVNSYVISFGVPFLISNNQLPVYNISKITSVPSDVSSYSWSLSNTDLDVTTEGMIYIAAEDTFGCTGEPGATLLQVPVQALPSVEQTGRFQWLMWVSLVGMSSMILGAAVTFLYNRSRDKYEFLWGNQATLRIQGLISLSRLRSRWVDSTLRERNVLYVEQEIQCAISRGQADEFEVAHKRLKFIRELGKGEFGKVYLGTLEGHWRSLVAIKISNRTEASTEPEARRQLLAEIDTMKRAGPHPHLVQLIATCTLPDKPICAILEYLEGGDLLAHLHRLRDYSSNNKSFHPGVSLPRSQRPSFSETVYTTLDNQSPTAVTFPEYPTNKPPIDFSKENGQTYVNITEDDSNESSDGCNDIDGYRFTSFALDIARGMEHLEARGIIHRDLAARNILLTADMSLKISDFGLSRNDGVYVIGNGEGGVRRLPVRWMAPEALRDRAFTSKSDVWSFAVVLWEIGSLGAFPYSEIQDDHLLRHVLRDEGRLERPSNVTSEIYDLMRSCWSSRPENRPTFCQLTKRLLTLDEPHKFFTATSNPCYSLQSAEIPNEKDSTKN